jgi:hypothetical protein
VDFSLKRGWGSEILKDSGFENTSTVSNYGAIMDHGISLMTMFC